jgi:D-arabinose 1-dehydrogenase-like Zn-dependent alcohol dehydrogenase
MVDTMRAERFYADSKIIAVEDIPIPDPGPGEVLVKVAFCGICHSDRFASADAWWRWE